MRPTATILAAAGLAALAGATAAAAADVSAKDPKSVVDALIGLGYAGKLEKLDSGRTSIAVQVSGLKTYIDFYDCDDDFTNCYTLLFNVSLNLDAGAKPEKANEWNSQQVAGRVFLDENNDPTLDYTLLTYDGLPAAVFEQNIKLWDRKIGDFKDFFDF